MSKIWTWLNESNRLAHLIGGLMVGALMGGMVALCGEYLMAIGAGVVTAAIVGASMEFKDKQWGGQFDWIDMGMTALGGLIGSGLMVGFVALLKIF